MEVMKKIIALGLVCVAGLQITGCSTVTQHKNPATESATKTQDKTKSSSKLFDVNSITKEDLKNSIEAIAKSTRHILVENSHLIHPDFNMKDIQILLVSNKLKTGYLINSQDEKYGDKEEVVEYSTDTIKDTAILTSSYSIMEFNDQPTYLINLDHFLYKISNVEEDLLKIIIHEAVHLVLQETLDNNKTSLEDKLEGKRSIQYPLDTEGRILRTQMAYCYKKALEAKNEEEQKQYIREGNYFLDKYMKISDQNKLDIDYDRVEGQASYYEHRGLAINEGLTDEDAITKRTKELYMKTDMFNNHYKQLNKSLEFYTIGSMAYALVYDLKEQEALGNENPVTYLLSRYGVKKSEGNEQLAANVEKIYKYKNDRYKEKIDGMTERINSEGYVTIKIPAYRRYKNSNVIYKNQSIDYDYKNRKMTLDQVTREINLNKDRIRLKDAYVLTEKDERGDYHYVTVPKEDVTFEDDKLTVQINEVQMYDVDFVKKDGIYQLVE